MSVIWQIDLHPRLGLYKFRHFGWFDRVCNALNNAALVWMKRIEEWCWRYTQHRRWQVCLERNGACRACSYTGHAMERVPRERISMYEYRSATHPGLLLEDLTSGQVPFVLQICFECQQALFMRTRRPIRISLYEYRSVAQLVFTTVLWVADL